MIGVFWQILLCRLNVYEYLVIRYLCDIVGVDFFFSQLKKYRRAVLVLCPVKCFGKIGSCTNKKRETNFVSLLSCSP